MNIKHRILSSKFKERIFGDLCRGRKVVCLLNEYQRNTGWRFVPNSYFRKSAVDGSSEHHLTLLIFPAENVSFSKAKILSIINTWDRNLRFHLWLIEIKPCNYNSTHSHLQYRGIDKSLARPGRKPAKVSLRMAWISFGALPCKINTLMAARFSKLLKWRASLTCFRACFLPGRDKDLSAPR